METDLLAYISSFLREEKIKMEFRTVSNSEFWLQSPHDSVAAKFVIDNDADEILYDVFSTEYDVHLKEETLRDVEKIDFIAEEHRKWKLAETAENIWLILDEIKLWARKNKFKVREKEMI